MVQVENKQHPIDLKKFLGIRQVHDALDSGTLSVVELTQSYLDAAKNSHKNAYITICQERALQQAQRSQDLLQKKGKVPRLDKPLLGIPLAIKDVLTIKGVRTTCASRVLENYVPPYTATCVERLESAGAIVLGKLNMDEFAMGGSNENSAFGPVLHPTHPAYVPGGSSGGSATAVKDHLCLAALGTDTGGSIREPASFCGLVGLKPTYGRVSRYGLVAFASSLDCAGTLTHSVEDAAIILKLMMGHDPHDSTSAPVEKCQWATDPMTGAAPAVDWKKIRVGVPREYFVEGIDPAVRHSVEQSLQWMLDRGAKKVEMSLPHSQYGVAVYYLVAVCEAASNLSRFDGIRYGVRPTSANASRNIVDYYKEVRSQFGPEVKRRILLGTFALSSGYYDAYYRRACQVRRLIKQDFDQAFEKVDVIVSPVVPAPAFKLGEKSKDPLQMYLMDLLTIPPSLAGLPAMSLPCGFSASGLPIGVQMIGPAFSEDLLFSLGHAFQLGFPLTAASKGKTK